MEILRTSSFFRIFWGWLCLPMAYAAVMSVGGIVLGYGGWLDQTMYFPILFGSVFAIHALLAWPIAFLVWRDFPVEHNQYLRLWFGCFLATVIPFDLLMAKSLIFLDESSVIPLILLMPAGAIVYPVMAIAVGSMLKRGKQHIS